MRTVEIIEHAAQMADVARQGEISNDAFAVWLTELNRVYREVFDLYPWDEVKILNLQVTTSDGNVVLPQFVETIRAVRIDDRPLFATDDVRVSNLAPAQLDDAGSASNFIHLARVPVQTQPTAATVIKIASTSSLDLAALGNVRIDGTLAGVRVFDEIALTGIAENTGTVSFDTLLQITKPKTTGRVSIRDSASVELGTIAPFDQRGNYKRIRLVPPVDQLTTVTLQVTRAFEELVSDDDSVVIPQAEGAIVSRLIASILRSAGDFDQAREWERDSQEKIQIAFNNTLEQNARSHQSTPAIGLFGHLGEDEINEHVSDPSVTGIGTTL